MAQRNNLPMMQNHVVVRLLDSIVVFGGIYKKYEHLKSALARAWKSVIPHDIWVFNLYTEQWRKYKTDTTQKAPMYICTSKHLTCGIAIEQDIYVFTCEPQKTTPFHERCAALWKLTRNRKGCFVWSDIVVERAPSFRSDSGAWEYGDKLWMFGGNGINPAEFGYVNEYVDFQHSCVINGTAYGANNQLICFEPSRLEWTSLKCSGDVPSPHWGQNSGSSAVIGDDAYVYRHKGNLEQLSDLHKLDMRNLILTEIRTVAQISQLVDDTSVNAITGNQLVFHGIGIQEQQRRNRAKRKTTTWILDVDLMSLREYTATMDDERELHRGVVGGLNSSCVMIIGGYHRYDCPSSYWMIRLEPKSLQELATKMIYENLAALPWKQLPRKLIQKIMGTSPEEDIEDEKIMGTSSEEDSGETSQL